MALWRSRLIAALASAAFLLPASHARRRRRAPKDGRRRLRPSMQPAPGTGNSSQQQGGIEDKSGEANPSAATLTPPSSGGDNQGNGRDSGPRQ